MSFCTSCQRPALRQLSSPSTSVRTVAKIANQRSPWPTRAHIKPPPQIPNPMPAIFPQLVILADGSSFTSYTTSPHPSTYKLTRDVTNNPLWDPARGLSGGSDEEGGRLSRFRARFEGLDGVGSNTSAAAAADASAGESSPNPSNKAFSINDFEWMGEGAKDERVTDQERQGPTKSGKKK